MESKKYSGQDLPGLVPCIYMHGELRVLDFFPPQEAEEIMHLERQINANIDRLMDAWIHHCES